MSPRQIAGRYELQQRLGTGGMSTVQQAVDSRLERRVAVKLLAEHLADDDNFVARFRREALAAARLVHPNIVQVFDFGLDEPTGQHYIVMELVEGLSCAELLRDYGTLVVDDALDIIGQACRGLDHAHRNGVVHRDVKPGNLLRSHDGVIKLADFGIAKAAEQSSITQVGSVLGTAAYLAPEQARGQEAGPPTDLYALGVVTYQLLSGRLPYEATSLSELALKQQNETPVPLDAVNPDVSATLALAVSHSLAIDPSSRYRDAAAMAEGLRAGARGQAPEGDFDGDATEATRMMTSSGERTAATRMMPPDALLRPPGRTPTRTERPRRLPERRRGWRPSAALVAFLVVAVIVGVGIWAIASQSGSIRQQPPVDADDPVEAIQQLQDLIDQNTR